jgi:hypothetical protein
MALPTLVASYLVPTTGSTSGTTTLVSPSFTPAPGEVIVAKAITAQGTFSGSGGGLTWKSYSRTGSDIASVFVMWAVVGSAPTSMTVSVGVSQSWPHAMVVERWSNATVAANPKYNWPVQSGSGAPLAELTTSAANSVITWMCSDWFENPVAGTTYRSSPVEERKFETANYSGWFAYQNAVTVGTHTFGMTAPTGQQWAMIGVEILGTTAGDVGAPAESILATTEPGAIPPRVRLDVSTTLPTVTLYRVEQDGKRIPVRSYDGGPFPVSGGTLVAYDGEAPLGLPVRYEAEETGITRSAEVTLSTPVDKVWLVHPGVPNRSRTIDIHSMSDRSYETVQSVRYPLGSKFPIIASDGARKAPTYELQLFTETLTDLGALEDLFKDTSPLLLQVPAAAGWGTVSEYVAVNRVTMGRVVQVADHPMRLWTLACSVTRRPVGGSQVDVTYAYSLSRFSTYSARLAGHATYGEAFDP